MAVEFLPQASTISAITNANPAQVTTTTNHLLVNGIIVRLLIPPTSGMRQANQLFGAITTIDNTNFTIAIDTTSFDLFTYNVNNNQQAQAVPFAEISSTLQGAEQNVLPGSTLSP